MEQPFKRDSSVQEEGREQKPSKKKKVHKRIKAKQLGIVTRTHPSFAYVEAEAHSDQRGRGQEHSTYSNWIVHRQTHT